MLNTSAINLQIIKFTLSGELLPSRISVKRPCNGWQKKDGANSSKQKLKFATFNPQTIKLLVKFGRHIKPRVVKAFCKKYY
ncbi:hypothetical protein A3223_07040 [Campylobacter concisus]|nr:hypothetical protein A3223_07040 [Campylobacter concisus]